MNYINTNLFNNINFTDVFQQTDLEPCQSSIMDFFWEILNDIKRKVVSAVIKSYKFSLNIKQKAVEALRRFVRRNVGEVSENKGTNYQF